MVKGKWDDKKYSVLEAEFEEISHGVQNEDLQENWEFVEFMVLKSTSSG